MKSILRVIVFVPLALIILFFSMANRGSVRIGLDPFAPNSGLSFEAPIFLGRRFLLARASARSPRREGRARRGAQDARGD